MQHRIHLHKNMAITSSIDTHPISFTAIAREIGRLLAGARCYHSTIAILFRVHCAYSMHINQFEAHLF